MKIELELLKMLRDYVDDPEIKITGLCGSVDAMRRKYIISISDQIILITLLKSKLPKRSKYYPSGDPYSAYVWKLGDKQPRLEFIDKLIKEKASQV